MAHRERELALKRLADPVVWRKADGKTVLVCDMSDAHLANSLRMLHRKATEWLDKNHGGLSQQKIKELRADHVKALRESPMQSSAEPLLDEWKHRFSSDYSWLQFAQIMDRTRVHSDRVHAGTRTKR